MTLQEIKERVGEIDATLAEKREGLEERSAEELDAIEKEVDALISERNDLMRQSVEIRSTVDKFEPIEATSESEKTKTEEKKIMRTQNKYSTEEYRKAFMDYVLYGDATYFRADATTTDMVGDVIVPTTITAKLYKVDPNAGQVYGQVTKTSYPAGIVLPIGELKPSLTWLAERSVAANTDAGTTSITFTGFKAQIKVAISFETDVMALTEFETMITAKINEAIAKGLDKAIVSGDGKGMPEGILAKESESDAKIYSVTDPDSYSEFLNAYKMIPASERAGAKLFINRADMLGHLYTVKDSEGKVAVVNTVNREGMFGYSFMGAEIVELDEDCGLGTYEEGGVFAFFFNPADYYLNINRDVTMKVYTDETTDDVVTKATLMADGKVVDTDSLVFLKVGTSTQSAKKA